MNIVHPWCGIFSGIDGHTKALVGPSSAVVKAAAAVKRAVCGTPSLAYAHTSPAVGRAADPIGHTGGSRSLRGRGGRGRDPPTRGVG